MLRQVTRCALGILVVLGGSSKPFQQGPRSSQRRKRPHRVASGERPKARHTPYGPPIFRAGKDDPSELGSSSTGPEDFLRSAGARLGWRLITEVLTPRHREEGLERLQGHWRAPGAPRCTCGDDANYISLADPWMIGRPRVSTSRRRSLDVSANERFCDRRCDKGLQRFDQNLPRHRRWPLVSSDPPNRARTRGFVRKTF